MKFRNIITNPALRLEMRRVSNNKCMESEEVAIMCKTVVVRRDGGKGEISYSN